MPKLLQRTHTWADQVRKLPGQAQQEQVAPSIPDYLAGSWSWFQRG